MKRLILGLAVLVSGVPSAATAGNIVVDGSFETPNIGTTAYVTVHNGESTLTGWTVGGNSIDIVSNLGEPGGAPFWAFDGNQSIDMAGTPGPGSISQNLPTVPNATYTLSFATLSNGGPYVNGLLVYWDGNLLDSITTPFQETPWTFHTYQVTASTDSTTLEFYTPIATTMGPLVDDVTVTTPEPSTLALLAIGFASVAGYGWRRNRKRLTP